MSRVVSTAFLEGSESHWPIVFLSLLRHIGEKYWLDEQGLNCSLPRGESLARRVPLAIAPHWQEILVLTYRINLENVEK
jgi:hypothetical protein